MKDYQYLMKRSGYRSFMDIPGRRTLNSDITEQERNNNSEEMNGSERYTHPSDRPAFPTAEPQSIRQSEAEQIAEEIENGELIDVAPGVIGDPLTGETNIGESISDVLEGVTPGDIGFSQSGQKNYNGSTYNPLAVNQRALRQPSNWSGSNSRAQEQTETMTLTSGTTQDRTLSSGGQDIRSLSTGMVYETGMFPDIIANPAYMPGYLRTQMGKLIHVDFYVGNTMSEQTGVLMQVGADYIILSAPNQGLNTICDLNSIRFVTILDNLPDTTILSAIN